MALNKSFWKRLRFIKGKEPDLICPTCKVGILRVVTGTFKTEDTADTKALKKSDYPVAVMDEDFRFSTLLRCNNVECQEVISCSGIGYYDQYDEQQPGEIYPTFYRFYLPEYFPVLLSLRSSKKK